MISLWETMREMCMKNYCRRLRAMNITRTVMKDVHINVTCFI